MNMRRVTLSRMVRFGLSITVALLVGNLEAAVSGAPAKPIVRTRAEVEALIAQAGATPPAWWDKVPLRHPPTLDLTWADPGKQWNAQKNLGQYMWDIINPNPSRWPEGAKLLHHVLTVNKDNPAKVEKTAGALAHVYQNLLQDWGRAAFWWRKVVKLGGYEETDYALDLGECYWKLGNREMCVELISKVDSDDTRNSSLIKLWADLGDLNKALSLVEDKAQFERPDAAFLAGGDACRLAGKYPQAMAYYQKVLAVQGDLTKGDLKRNRERAQASLAAIRLFDALDLKRIPSGLYTGNSPAYAGLLHVEVKVAAARIESVRVTRHQEKQFYGAIANTTSQIVQKQGVKAVDMTTGATITAEAIVNATAKALASGMK